MENVTLHRCPICAAGDLIQIGPDLWHCEQAACNNEFFIDGPVGERSLSVRDKPGWQAPAVPRWRGWAVRTAMVAAGIGLMAWEGSRQPSPGVWFVVAMAAIVGAFVPWRDHEPPAVCKKCGCTYWPPAISGDCVQCWWDEQP